MCYVVWVSLLNTHTCTCVFLSHLSISLVHSVCHWRCVILWVHVFVAATWLLLDSYCSSLLYAFQTLYVIVVVFVSGTTLVCGCRHIISYSQGMCVCDSNSSAIVACWIHYNTWTTYIHTRAWVSAPTSMHAKSPSIRLTLAFWFSNRMLLLLLTYIRLLHWIK